MALCAYKIFYDNRRNKSINYEHRAVWHRENVYVYIVSFTEIDCRKGLFVSEDMKLYDLP